MTEKSLNGTERISLGGDVRLELLGAHMTGGLLLFDCCCFDL
jgi:hypothetical protein